MIRVESGLSRGQWRVKREEPVCSLWFALWWTKSRRHGGWYLSSRDSHSHKDADKATGSNYIIHSAAACDKHQEENCPKQQCWVSGYGGTSLLWALEGLRQDDESQASLAYIPIFCLPEGKTEGSVELPRWVRVPATMPKDWVTHFTKNDMVEGES